MLSVREYATEYGDGKLVESEIRWIVLDIDGTDDGFNFHSVEDLARSAASPHSRTKIIWNTPWTVNWTISPDQLSHAHEIMPLSDRA